MLYANWNSLNSEFGTVFQTNMALIFILLSNEYKHNGF